MAKKSTGTMRAEMSAIDATVLGKITTARDGLAALLEANCCSICHDVYKAPVSLPCSHLFCSECLRRHLLQHSICPQPFCRTTATTTDIKPHRNLDAALAPLRLAAVEVATANAPPAAPSGPQQPDYLVFLSSKAAGVKAKLVESLAHYEMSTLGNVDMLALRYREFVLKWNSNVDAAVPKSWKAVAREAEEALRSLAKNPRTSPFFKKPQKVAPVGKTDDSHVPVEGDTFDDLIRKIRARKLQVQLLRQERPSVESASSRGEKITIGNADSLTATQDDTSVQAVGQAQSESQRQHENASKLSVAEGVCAMEITGAPSIAKESLHSTKNQSEVIDLTDQAVGPVRKRPRVHNGPVLHQAPAPHMHMTPPRHCPPTFSQTQPAQGAFGHALPTQSVPTPLSADRQYRSEGDSPHVQTQQMLNPAAAPPSSSNSQPAALSEEVRQKIEENRLRAIERKKRFLARQKDPR